MKYLTTILLLASLGVMGQSKKAVRYINTKYHGTAHIKYYTLIDSNHNLKYYQADTIHVETGAAEKEYFDGKYWYQMTSDFPTFYKDYRYFINGKEIHPVEVKHDEHYAISWQRIFITKP